MVSGLGVQTETENEEVKLGWTEFEGGWYALSGFSKTKHGHLELKGFIKPDGHLFVFKAEDVIDASEESSRASAGTEKGVNKPAARRRRLKLTKPTRSPLKPIKVPKKSAMHPQHISGPNSMQNWDAMKGCSELMTNLIDQVRTTLKEEFPHDTPPLEPPQTTRNEAGELHTVFFAGSTKLAEIIFKKTRTKYVRSYALKPNKYEPEEVDRNCLTWVLKFINHGSGIEPHCFLRGVSGAEKANNLECIGKFGDGLKSAMDLLVRLLVNVVVTTAGFTTTAVLERDGNSYMQHSMNKQTERRVDVTLTFSPELPPDGINPDLLDPMSVFLSPSEDGVSTVHGTVLLGEEMRGMLHNRDFRVAEMGSAYLFGFNLKDPRRDLIQGRDRGAMNPKLTRKVIIMLVREAILKSSRIRRRIVLALTRGGQWTPYGDIQAGAWGEEAITLIQNENLVMFPGTVLANHHPPICAMIAEVKDLTIKRCHQSLDQGSALVRDFVNEVRSLPREDIGQDAAASGWATTVREELLRLTGATEFAAVDFPGKLGTRHVVWVEADVVLVSRRSLAVNLRQEDVKTAKYLLDTISCSMERELSFEKLSERAFEVYHLIISASAAAPSSEAPSPSNGELLADGAQENGANPQPGGLGVTGAAPAPADATAPESVGKGEQDGEGASAAAAAAANEESGEESDGVSGREVNEADGDAGAAADDSSEDSGQGAQARKRSCDMVREQDSAGVDTVTKRQKQGGSAEENGSGTTPPILEQSARLGEQAARAAISTVSVKFEPNASEIGASSLPQQLNGIEPAPALGQPGSSQPEGLVDGTGMSQEAEEVKNGDPLPSALGEGAAPIVPLARKGEELGAFLSGALIVPALSHVLQADIGDAGKAVDLYRIVGCKENGENASERFRAVLASEPARRVLESAVKQQGVDISFFCWDKPDALRGFVGHGGRIFVNLSSSKTVHKWAEEDLPTMLAHEMAHLRSSTSGDVHSHAWSVEFRKCVRSEDF
ncbi:expressed unknown protein [Ectocarpus siliculosus]|uniref:Uncharacterized protein n=1 Tax=Ectocarpus siliculosus TaxID=2880 RepID=D8LMF7_ECTSI|nr:expressed unknown protein [Ectocarpus siliculosus]|eukprot:CBN77567.1 expressed unknown protein [Ectocarpus siliculosus]